MVRPEDWLQGDQRKEFLTPSKRILDPPPAAECYPKPCYRVAKSVEDQLRSKLLQCGAARLIRAQDVARRPDG
eukprot:451274-Karenia_brevis.AAC.1